MGDVSGGVRVVCGWRRVVPSKMSLEGVVLLLVAPSSLALFSAWHLSLICGRKDFGFIVKVNILVIHLRSTDFRFSGLHIYIY